MNISLGKSKPTRGVVLPLGVGPLVTPRDSAVAVAEDADEEITPSHRLCIEVMDRSRAGTKVFHAHALPAIEAVDRLEHRLPVFRQILADRAQERFPDCHPPPNTLSRNCSSAGCVSLRRS